MAISKQSSLICNQLLALDPSPLVIVMPPGSGKSALVVVLNSFLLHEGKINNQNYGQVHDIDILRLRYPRYAVKFMGPRNSLSQACVDHCKKALTGKDVLFCWMPPSRGPYIFMKRTDAFYHNVFMFALSKHLSCTVADFLNETNRLEKESIRPGCIQMSHLLVLIDVVGSYLGFEDGFYRNIRRNVVCMNTVGMLNDPRSVGVNQGLFDVIAGEDHSEAEAKLQKITVKRPSDRIELGPRIIGPSKRTANVYIDGRSVTRFVEEQAVDAAVVKSADVVDKPEKDDNISNNNNNSN